MTASVNFIPYETELDYSAGTALAAELAQAMRQVHIELGEIVVVVGEGRPARLAAELARVAGALSVHRVGPAALDGIADKSADVVIFASDDTRALRNALRVARNLGRVLLLSAARPIDFDVYPDLHKRSIRLISVAPQRGTSPQMLDFARYLIQSGRLNLTS
jgi:threonine dehydrogenase-like Zn-dependent dehydrogenase